ncbi:MULTISPECIES: UPF0158 family protein [Bizionia]|uniref:Uncharacterized protein n=1 Tax=Bizionia algoritergicola TaxID=291187 RepID=A0A5D0R3V7_9FLAO|nr:MULTISPECIES: UPF0158 family protein [Bizionia]OBX17483.1 hypothetical protein BAA08_16310 [Bizionia sp. APA-3]TYB75655.1 hypothetical protein ES675_05920 [Bizionia algoritergicola]
MNKPNSEIISEIVQELDSGCDCYLNNKTHEIIAIPNFGNFPDEVEFQELFKEDLMKVSEQASTFIKIEVLKSYESFKIMERFAQKLPNSQFKTKLETILLNKKPFQNFKLTVETSEYRKLWFDFKRQEMEEMVCQKLA